MTAPRPQPKRRKKGKQSSRRDYCDRLWRFAIRERDKTCQCTWDSDCEGSLEAAHLIRRRFRSTRWNPQNGVLLCQRHHRELDGVFDVHDFGRQRIGPDEWEALRLSAQERFHGDLDLVKDELKAYREGLKTGGLV